MEFWVYVGVWGIGFWYYRDLGFRVWGLRRGQGWAFGIYGVGFRGTHQTPDPATAGVGRIGLEVVVASSSFSPSPSEYLHVDSIASHTETHPATVVHHCSSDQ